MFISVVSVCAIKIILFFVNLPMELTSHESDNPEIGVRVSGRGRT